MLPNIIYRPLEDLAIEIGRIRSGWMDITIYNGLHTYAYTTGYCTDPLNDLLTATLQVLKGQPYTDKTGNKISNYYYVDHDLEGSSVAWTFDVDGDTLRLTIWQDPPCELIEYWDTGCNMESIEYYELTHTFPDLPVPLFAFEGSKKTFAITMRELFITLDARPVRKRGYNGWGYKYNAENFAVMVKLLK